MTTPRSLHPGSQICLLTGISIIRINNHSNPMRYALVAAVARSASWGKDTVGTDAVSCLRSYSCVGLTISARSHHSLHDVETPQETRPPGQTFTGAKATGKSSIGRVYTPNTSTLEHRQAAQRPCGSPRAACVIAATTPWREDGLGVTSVESPSRRPSARSLGCSHHTRER